MKHLLLMLTFLPVFLFAQNKDAEFNAILKLSQSGELDQVLVQEKLTDWAKFIKDYGGYPEIPYNAETERVIFKKVIECPGLTTEQIYDRSMEWVSRNYGSLGSVLHYENLITGKIVIKASFDIYHKKEPTFFLWFKDDDAMTNCTHTLILTIKDGKCKIENENILFYQYYATTEGQVFMRTKGTPLQFIYPISIQRNNEWKRLLSLLESTTKHFDLLYMQIQLHINSIEKDYSF